MKQGDVIVACDGKTESLTEGQFHASIRLNHYEPGSDVALTVLREGQQKQLIVRF